MGYNYGFGRPNNKKTHSLDFGTNTAIIGGRHLGGASFGFGSEFIFNSNFTIGPKINATVYYQFLVFGFDFVNYTDFKNITSRFVPFLGIGFHKFRVTFNPQIILFNKNFNPINKGAINFTFNITLTKKKKHFNETSNKNINP